MCIGLPAKTLQAWPGGALVLVRGRHARVDTRLVGDVQPGDWLLVHQHAARERLDAARAAEIESALALLEAGLAGDAARAQGDPGFTLPSSLSAEALIRATSS
jgi:hydrogenase expression/formation protein HypC